MKKIVATVAIFSIILSGLYAQTDFRFGFEVSPSFSWMKTDNNKINNNGTNVGLRLGLMGEKYISENYAITFGIGFAFNQGGKLAHDIGGNLLKEADLSDPALNVPDDALPNGVNIKYKTQYVEIPIGFKMRTQEFGYMKYYAELPRFILGIRSQARGDLNGTYQTGNIPLNSEKEDVKGNVHLVNYSWGIGAGAEYSLNENTAIIAGLYYQNSMFDIIRNNGTQYVVDDNGTPDIQSDDIITTPKEDSKSTQGSITIRIGVIF